MRGVAERVRQGLISGYLIECFPDYSLLIFSGELALWDVGYVRDNEVDDKRL